MYSFDIFDTIITRTTNTPQGIFALMQRKLESENTSIVGLDTYIRSNFAILREQAESLAHSAYMGNGVQEVTLQQVYQAMNVCGLMTKEQMEQLMELEIQTELSNVVPVKENIARIAKLLARGERVILISDMYLDREIILKMLAAADPLLVKLPLYVSSDQKKGKWTGSLFRYVQQEERVEYADWTHIGDNPKSDVEIPKSLGIRVEQYNPKHRLDAAEPYTYSPLATQERQDVLEAVEQTLQNQDRAKKVPYCIGATYGGAILYPYVSWILDQFEKKGTRRLYFIARDGYILQKIADEIIATRGLEIETKYIYGSRKAWRMASVSEKNSDIRAFFKWSHERKILNMKQLAEVFEIEVEELQGFLPKFFLRPDFALTRAQLNICEQMLDDNPRFVEFLMEHHKRKRQIAVDYLKQELDVSDDKYAFVELAGSGFTQECLAHIMEEFYTGVIQTYFFKRDRVEYDRSICNNQTFFPGLMKMHIMIEMICRAPHGQTWGYRREGERIIPDMHDAEEQELIDCGYEDYIDGIVDFAQNYTKLLCEKKRRAHTMNLMVDYLRELSEHPNKETLHFFADLPNNETGRDHEPHPYAPILTKQDLQNLYLYRTTEPVEQFYQGTYLDYSLLRCTDGDRRRIAFYQRHHDDWIVKRMRIGRCRREAVQPEQAVTEKYRIDERLLQGRIALYGAGKVGQAICRAIAQTPQAQLAVWVDADYSEYSELPYPVENISRLKDTEYDILLIAVAKKAVAEEIVAQLQDTGIASYKIVLFPDWRMH